MRVRLVDVPRTLEGLNGQSFHRGGSYELPLGLAGLLMLEGWAVAEPDESEDMLPTEDDADFRRSAPPNPTRRRARRESF